MMELGALHVWSERGQGRSGVTLPASLFPEGVVSSETASSQRCASFLPVGSASVHYGFLVFPS